MTRLAVWGIILPLLVIVLSLPVGVDVRCTGGALSREGILWFVPFPLEAKKKESSRPAPRWGALQVLNKNGYTTLCRLVSRMRVERLVLHITAAAPDPSMAALLYGVAGIVLEGLSSLRGDFDLRVEADFESVLPRLEGAVTFSAPLWRLMGEGLRFGAGALRERHEQKQRERIYP